jgi:hypothetical protein
MVRGEIGCSRVKGLLIRTPALRATPFSNVVLTFTSPPLTLPSMAKASAFQSGV